MSGARAAPGEAPGGTARGGRREGDPPLLRVEDLRTWFEVPGGVARAVDGVSFEVRDGETLGLVGESGSGKSVTALSILGLLGEAGGSVQPGSSVRLRGEELTSAPEERMREVRGGEIAMVFQEPMTSLNPVMPVGAQVVEGILAHRPVSRRRAREEAETLLRRVGIAEASDRFGAYPHQLSGGQRQRVMIAMALGPRPSLLVADEPTTALDVTVQAQIVELLASLQEERGLAVLFITHDLGLVAETADRVAVMYAGQLVEEAPAEALFRRPLHPYTEGLLAAVPDPDRPVRRLAAIEGEVPHPARWPEGCRFHPRCPHAWARCGAEAPPLLPGEGEGRPGAAGERSGRAARCWLLEEPGRREGRG